MSRFTKLLAAAAVGVAFASAAHADVIVDDFSVVQGPIVDLTSGDSGIWAVQAGPSMSIIGGYRDIFVTKFDDPADDGVDGVRMRASGGAGGSLRFSTDTGQSGVGIVRWDGITQGTGSDLMSAIASINPTGLGGVDLASAGSGFLISVLQADLNFNFTLQAYTDAANYSSIALTSTGPNNYFIPFAAFAFGNVGSGADFSNIGALQAIVNFPGTAVRDIDFQVDFVNVVPEPASLALVGLGLLAAGAAHRRRKAA